MATCAVSGNVTDITETNIQNIVVKANLVNPVIKSTTQIFPKEVETTTDASGDWTLNLAQGVSAIITIEYFPDATNSKKRQNFTITVPATSTAEFGDLATEI